MRNRHATDRDRGFTLIELLVVVAIIVIGAAMALPSIGRYFRNYRIREAQEQIVGAVQRARAQAISKNVNLGVSFVIQGPARYWVHVEDDQSAARTRDHKTLSYTAPETLQSTLFELPRGIRFATGSGECPNSTANRVGGASFSPNGGWFRFNRLGAWCTGVGCTTTTDPPAASSANLLMSDANGSLICIVQPETGLSRALLVSPGGRVRIKD